MADCDTLFLGGTIKGAAEVAREMGANLPDNWVPDYYRRMHLHPAKGVSVGLGHSGSPETVWKKQGIPHCIVSNGPPEKMQITLGQHGLWDRFQGRIFSAHTHGTAKPDPELLWIAARQFNVAPANCIVVDDSPSGCTGAANAGMPCIGFAERSNPEKLAATGATVIRSMAEIAAASGADLVGFFKRPVRRQSENFHPVRRDCHRMLKLRCQRFVPRYRCPVIRQNFGFRPAPD